MQKFDYLIVGAGLFGATFAHLASQKGKSCIVIDHRDHIAGNCYTKQEKGIMKHVYGAHIFHTDKKEIWDFVNLHADFNDFINTPIARTGDAVYNLPFNMNLFAKVFGVCTPQEAKQAIKNETEKYKKLRPKNLEEQAKKLIGDTLYDMFVKGYTEKQWGRPCTNLPASTIKRLPLRFTFNNNYFTDKYQGIPKRGYTDMIMDLLRTSQVILNMPFKQAQYHIDYKEVVYTGAIDEYFDYSLGALDYRSLKFVDKTIDTKDYQGVAVVNYPTLADTHTRTIEHKHFDPSNDTPHTIVSWEYPIEHEPGKTDPYYPIGNPLNIRLYNRYKRLADKQNSIYFAGRLGEYRYYDMDDTIEKAMELAQRLIR